AAGHSSESLQRLRDVIAGVDQATSAIFSATDTQFASTRQLASRVTQISSAMAAVAQDIRGAQETSQTAEKMSADVVQAASVIDEQAEHLREKVAQFVMQLRNSDSSQVTQAAAPSAAQPTGDEQAAQPLRTSATSSISTQAPRGSWATPKALRA